MYQLNGERADGSREVLGIFDTLEGALRAFRVWCECTVYSYVWLD